MTELHRRNLLSNFLEYLIICFKTAPKTLFKKKKILDFAIFFNTFYTITIFTILFPKLIYTTSNGRAYILQQILQENIKVAHFLQLLRLSMLFQRNGAPHITPLTSANT